MHVEGKGTVKDGKSEMGDGMREGLSLATDSAREMFGWIPAPFSSSLSLLPPG